MKPQDCLLIWLAKIVSNDTLGINIILPFFPEYLWKHLEKKFLFFQLILELRMSFFNLEIIWKSVRS